MWDKRKDIEQLREQLTDAEKRMDRQDAMLNSRVQESKEWLNKSEDHLRTEFNAKLWGIGVVGALAIAVLGFLGYQTIRDYLERYAQHAVDGYLGKKELEAQVDKKLKAIVDSKAIEFQARLAEANGVREKYELAVRELKDLPISFEYGKPLPREYVERFEAFDKTIEELKQENAYSSGDWAKKGMLAYEKKDYADCIRAFSAAIQEHESPSLYIVRGLAYYNQGEYDRSMADFDRGIELNARSPDSYYGRGFVYAAQGKHDEAIADFNKAIRLDPGFLQAYRQRGEAYLTDGKYDKAMADFNKVIQLNPSLAEGYCRRGAAHAMQHRYGEAGADFDKAIELKSDYVSAYLHRGAIRLLRPDGRQQAFDDFNRALEISPECVAAYVSRGYAYATQNENKKAIADFDKAIELDSNVGSAYCGRGDAYLCESRYEEASHDYAKALKMGVKEILLLPNMAISLIVLGSQDDALEVLEIFRSSYALNPQGQLIYSYLKTVAQKMIEKDTSAMECEIDSLLRDNTELGWASKVIDSWLEHTDISLDKKQYIAALAAKIRGRSNENGKDIQHWRLRLDSL